MAVVNEPARARPAPRSRRRNTSQGDKPAAPRIQWQPRDYQRVPFEKLAAGVKRQMFIWHRRAGKDRTALELCAAEMKTRVGNYWHMFPKLVQAKKAIWLGVDPGSGVRFLDQTFPDRRYTNDQDLFLRVPNGSTWQLCGSDSYDRLVGAGPVGCVFSEWALCDPQAWDYIRPMLLENGGWAIFITTYRGRNHAYQMAKRLANEPGWYVDVRTIQQTRRIDGSPVISVADVDREIAQGMRRSLAEQEYYCRPEAALPGSIYGPTVATMLEQRSGSVLHDATYPVVAAWNLEDYPANLSVVFFQERAGENVILASYTWTLEASLANAVAELAALPWKVTTDIVAANSEGVWPELFALQGRHCETVTPYSHAHTVAITNTMLGRTVVDTVPRPYAQRGFETNNEILIDSLNGYRLAELRSEGRENFDAKPETTYERYLTRAVEIFASWQFSRGGHRNASRRPGAARDALDYSAYDRTVI
jgi:hypothetical protein